MKKYYLMAIEKGNVDTMTDLGDYYNYIEKNYDLMKKYYLMAIEKGNNWTMFNLHSSYYQYIEINEILIAKYYFILYNKQNTICWKDHHKYNYLDIIKKIYNKKKYNIIKNKLELNN